MQNIVIPEPQNNSLVAQFIALHQVLAEIKKSPKVSFDFSNLKEIYPLTILPICAYIQDTGSSYICLKNPKINSYLEKNKFPNGTKELLANSSNLPINLLSNFPDIKTRDELIYNFGKKLYEMMGSVEGTRDALFYPISEFTTNIFEHSKKAEGWVFAQVDKQKNILDICIVDSGRGLRKERGFGVRTSKNLVCDDLKGSFLIVSGSAALITEGKDEKLLELDKPIWNGVVLAYQIPLPKGPVDIYKYVE